MIAPRRLALRVCLVVAASFGVPCRAQDVPRRPPQPWPAGAVEYAALGRVTGWAYLPGEPGPVSVRVRVGDAPAITVRADRPSRGHPELGPEPHGFDIDVTALPAAGGLDLARVRLRVEVPSAGLEPTVLEDRTVDLGFSRAPYTLERKVLVFSLDPVLEGKPLHEQMGWPSPEQLTRSLIAELENLSGHAVSYRVYKFLPTGSTPYALLRPGALAEYRTAVERGTRLHDDLMMGRIDRARFVSEVNGLFPTSGLDVPRVLYDHAVISNVEAGLYHEVWIWRPPFVFAADSAMGGRKPYPLQGWPVSQTDTTPRYVVMSFDSSLGVPHALHSFAHRAADILKRARADLWASFGGDGGMGSVDVPPNAQLADASPFHAAAGFGLLAPLDTTCRVFVNTGRERFAGMPSETDPGFWQPPVSPTRRQLVSQAGGVQWATPEPDEGYARWWLSRLPNGADGKDSWWRCVADPDGCP